MSPKQPGYVYLFRNEFNYTKIGHAINPHNRAKTIESSSGLTIVESYMSPVCFNHLEIKGALKRQFSDYRKKGEWFDIEFDTVKAALDSYFPETGTPTIKPIIAISNQSISNSEDEPAVNARDLHAWLESKQEFANWIKNRIATYEFVEGQDFTVDKFINGKATQVDYFISLDMAKELSMVERTAKGKEARQYFIACEKALKQGKPTMVDHDLRSLVYTTVQEALAEFYPSQRTKKPIVDTRIINFPDDFVQFIENALRSKNTLKIRINSFYQDYLRVATEHVSKARFGRLVKAYCKQHRLKFKNVIVTPQHEKTVRFYIISRFMRGVK